MAAHRLIAALLALLVVAAAAPAEAELPARLAALQDLQINQPVAGDVFILAGDIHLGPEARVDGHAIALLGTVELAEGAEVSGRVIAVTSLAGLSLQPGSETEMPTLDAAVRLLSSGGWMLVATAIAFLLPGRIRRGMGATRQLPGRVFLLGVMVTLTIFVALVAVLGLGTALGAPLAGSVMVVFFAVKAVGLTVTGGLIGAPLLRRWSRRRLPLSFAVLVGVALLLLGRLLPVAGGVLWDLVSVAALGAGVLTIALESNPFSSGVVLDDNPSANA